MSTSTEPRRKRGRPRNDSLHEWAEEEGVTARQKLRDMHREIFAAVYPEDTDLPQKVRDEIALGAQLVGQQDIPALIGINRAEISSVKMAISMGRMDLIESLPATNKEAAPLRAKLAAASPATAEIAFARERLADGWTAHTVAAELRRRRLARFGPSQRGDAAEKRRRAINAITAFAFDKAAVLIGASGQDEALDAVWALASDLCEEAAAGCYEEE